MPKNIKKKSSIKKKKGKPTPVNFQDTILNLQKFWGNYGCVILQPYDIEVGAGTFHPATTLRSLGPKPWKAASPLQYRFQRFPNQKVLPAAAFPWDWTHLVW